MFGKTKLQTNLTRIISRMGIAAIALSAAVSLISCGGGLAPWLTKLDGKPARFKIQVLKIPGLDRAANVKLTEQFGRIWKEKTGRDYFVADDAIIKKTLEGGKLIPSTNFLITGTVLQLPGNHIISFSVTNKTTGEILSAAKLRYSSPADIGGKLSSAASRLSRAK